MKRFLIIPAILSLMLIVALSGCTTSKQTSPTVAPVTTGFVGLWDTNFDNLTITANGNAVSGTYGFRNGTLTGTVSGNVLTGTWGQSYSDNPDYNSGDCVLTLSSDGQSFTGNWRYGHSTDSNASWDGSWDGTRIT